MDVNALQILYNVYDQTNPNIIQIYSFPSKLFESNGTQQRNSDFFSKKNWGKKKNEILI